MLIRLDFHDIALQADLNRMNDGQTDDKRQFNMNKCRILSVCRWNPHSKYKNRPQSSVKFRIYLGVIVSSDIGLRKEFIDTRNKTIIFDEC